MRSIAKKTARALKTASLCHRIVPVWHPGYLRVYSRALRICRQGRFEPYEAYRLGLFKPAFEENTLDDYTSRKITTKLQKAVNPESWGPLLKNKGLFYRYLMACELPVPRLYAIFFKQVPGWSPDGSILAGRADWERFLAAIPADEFVIKRCTGAFGEGFKIFTRMSGEFKDTLGSTFKAADIYDLMRTDTGVDSFVIQERLCNHPEIYRLNPSEFLQTVRVITFIDRGGVCRILFAYLKLIRGRNTTDNIQGGISGNMLVIIRIEDGTLGPGRLTLSDGRGAQFFNRHPQTGVEFETLKMPRWAEITALAKKAALNFLPIRTIGWDIAITPADIKIVEGNIWWNPLNHSRWKNVIKAELPYDF